LGILEVRWVNARREDGKPGTAVRCRYEAWMARLEKIAE
jgi:hypothetical protein